MKKLLLLILFMAAGYAPLYAVDTIGTQMTSKDTLVHKLNTTAAMSDSVNPISAKQASLQTVAPNAVEGDCQPAGGLHVIVGWSLIVIIVVVFLMIAVRSNLLRASITDPSGFMKAAKTTNRHAHEADINKIPKPFSLSRSQLGAWTVVISCSYIYLELCKYVPTQQIPIDNTLLALMGISAGTAAASNVIDTNSTPDQQGLQAPSEGFIKDILSDQNGINIHRFQNVVWTLIAIVLYIGQIPHLPCGVLPTLDSTLIALTGISSATYLGLKINENKPPALPHTPNASPEPNGPQVTPDPPLIPVAPVAPVVPPVSPVAVVVPPVTQPPADPATPPPPPAAPAA
jgi:hypothetical protein